MLGLGRYNLCSCAKELVRGEFIKFEIDSILFLLSSGVRVMGLWG